VPITSYGIDSALSICTSSSMSLGTRLVCVLYAYGAGGDLSERTIGCALPLPTAVVCVGDVGGLIGRIGVDAGGVGGSEDKEEGRSECLMCLAIIVLRCCGGGVEVDVGEGGVRGGGVGGSDSSLIVSSLSSSSSSSVMRAVDALRTAVENS
jgi:hypothetical protein